MPALPQLSRRDARRVAVRAQLLTAERPTDLMELVRHLTLLQYDVTQAVAPSHDVVAWSRLGAAYSPAELREHLDEQRLIEHQVLIRPAPDLALYRADMADWPGRGELQDWQVQLAEWVHANDDCRLGVLDALRQDGPLPTRELPDTCAVPWRSSGWNNFKDLRMLLGLMVERGEIALVGREGPDKLWDLAERVYPDDPVVPAEEAARERSRRRLVALGIARARAARTPNEPDHVGDTAVTMTVEGVRGRWQVLPELLDEPFTGRVALLSPLDRLVFDRKRMAQLFEFDYQLEMYKPKDQRRWGYWALPILVDDALVGKLDATADRDAGELIVHAVHEDHRWPASTRAAVHEEIAALADWLGLGLVLP